VELPAGPLRLRATGSGALIEALGEESNRRIQGDAALVLPLGWRGRSLGTISLDWVRAGDECRVTLHRNGPRRFEGGTYWELGGDGALSFSVDLGAGGQRVAEQGAAVGPWKVALRAWAMLAVDLSRTIQWRTEAEAYRAPFASAGVATTQDWRYRSVSTGLYLRLP